MKYLNRTEESVLAVSMFISALLVFVNVLFRMFGSGIAWSEEMVRYLIILLTFIGISTGIRQGSQYCIDLLPSVLKGFSKSLLSVIISLIAIVFSCFVIYYGWMAAQFTQGTNQMSPALQIPMYLVYGIIPVSGAFILLRYIMQLYGQLTQRKEG